MEYGGLALFGRVRTVCKTNVKQEAQLMLTNPRNAFSDQSKSPNKVTFHMLGIVSC